MSAIGDGLHQPSMKWRLADLDGEKRLLNARLSDGKEPSPVRVHPNLAEAYRRRVSELEILLEDPELRDEAVEAIGSLIEVVLIHPIEGGYEIELMGEIANMVELTASSSNTKAARLGAALNAEERCSVKLVAGARNYRYRHSLEVAI